MTAGNEKSSLRLESETVLPSIVGQTVEQPLAWCQLDPQQVARHNDPEKIRQLSEDMQATVSFKRSERLKLDK